MAPILAAALGGGGLAASPPDWPAGAVLDSVTSVADPSQTYAVYLPSAYHPDRRWPVVMLMDPRGRARLPLELFRPAAERLGYVLISSYSTASDTFEDVNTPAVHAMFEDARSLVTADSTRFYLAGFSGTARIAWTFAQRLAPSIAGILGFGGALPLGHPAPWEAGFAYFGAAGILDFNYEEMQTLDRNLDVRGQPHRFEFFDGGHQWGPPAVCGRGLEFMELEAIRSGGARRDPAWLEALHRDRRAWADAAAHPYERLLRLRAVVEDFRDLLDADVLRGLAAEVAVLEASEDVQIAVRRREASARTFRIGRRRLEELAKGSPAMDGWSAERILAHLEIEDLRRRADEPSHPEAAHAARRLLSLMYVHTSFYLPQDHVAQGDSERAITFLQVAAAIAPLSARQLEHDFPSLRAHPRFLELLAAATRP